MIIEFKAQYDIIEVSKEIQLKKVRKLSRYEMLFVWSGFEGPECDLWMCFG